VTVVVSAANSAARKRSGPSNPAARGSRVPDQAADGMSDGSEGSVPEGSFLSEEKNRAGGRAAKAREELAAVPSQEPQGDLADDLDVDGDLDDGDLDGAVDLEELEDLSNDLVDDLSEDGLGAEDLEIIDTPDTDLAEADLSDEQEEGDEPEPAAAGAVVVGAAPADGKAAAEGSDDEIFVFGDDDDDLPAAQVAVAGATADPVKDYLKQIGKVPLLNAEQEVELAKRIEAGLFAEEKLAES
jgi:RNA polymerase primary sigma factor